MIEVLNLVGGRFIKTEETFEDISPLDDRIIASIPRTKSVEDAVIAAEKALSIWSNLTIHERCTWLERIADELEKEIEEVARLESLDTGKPHEVALNVDANRSVYNFRFFAEFGKEIEEKRFEMSDATNLVVRKTVGVVGLISTWNLPLYLLSWKLAQSLAQVVTR